MELQTVAQNSAQTATYHWEREPGGHNAISDTAIPGRRDKHQR